MGAGQKVRNELANLKAFAKDETHFEPPPRCTDQIMRRVRIPLSFQQHSGYTYSNRNWHFL
jgi:hypothetical protein